MKMSSRLLLGGFSRMLNKNIMSPKVYEVPGAQNGPLFLEFYVYFDQNRPEIVTRVFSRMINANMTISRVSEAPGTEVLPCLLEFHIFAYFHTTQEVMP